ncbi:hypothetical protein ACGFIW_22310 [Micromonospora sp. NPDC048935]|uniref:hypothetical protein n=1 Tax=Micromonospora sp. NPDC048935 TaxID=3364262 RepID=UPI0037129C07
MSDQDVEDADDVVFAHPPRVVRRWLCECGVDPVLAESLVWAALGERPPVPHDVAAIVARTVLLLGLLEDEGLTDRELDEILVAAAHAAGDSPQGTDRHQVGAPAQSDRR